MSSKSLRIALALAGLLIALPASVSAQIYTWRDDAGTLVLSNKPREGGAMATFTVPGHDSQAFRTTRPATSRRAQAYDAIIDQHASRHGVSPSLVRAVIQAESAFNPLARSHKGAMGLMQLMPATARDLGVVDPYDAEENIGGGVTYLKSLLVKYEGNQELALAAYNAGPGAVEKYGAVPPYRETRNYVAKIQRNAGTQAPRPSRIYKTVEVVNGREVVRYTNVPPAPAVSASASR